MKEVFADADYWVGLVNPNDNLHEIAIKTSRSFGEVLIITTDWVLCEFLTVIKRAARPLIKDAFITYHDIVENPNVIIEPATRDSFLRGFDLYKERADRGCSVIDCISFSVIRNRQIKDVLTADRHFKQEGFTTLLRPTPGDRNV
jgi:predicted nucleic acid-binding protein